MKTVREGSVVVVVLSCWMVNVCTAATVRFGETTQFDASGIPPACQVTYAVFRNGQLIRAESGPGGTILSITWKFNIADGYETRSKLNNGNWKVESSNITLKPWAETDGPPSSCAVYVEVNGIYGGTVVFAGRVGPGPFVTLTQGFSSGLWAPALPSPKNVNSVGGVWTTGIQGGFTWDNGVGTPLGELVVGSATRGTMGGIPSITDSQTLILAGAD